MTAPGATLWTLSELADIAADLSVRLVPQQAWNRVRAIPRLLPAVFSVGGLECRLRAGDDRVDYHGCIRADTGRSTLRSWFDHHDPAAVPDRWQPALSFLRNWCDPQSACWGTVAAAWLEFDLASPDIVPAPFAIATLTPPWAMDEPWSRERLADVVLATVDALDGTPGGERDDERVSAVARANTRRCILDLPPSSYVAHVAVPTRPGARSVRLILNLPWKEVPAYLGRIGADFIANDVEAWLASLCATSLIHPFHLDVGEEIGPRLSCEFCFNTSPRQDPRWTALLDRLVATGSCSADKRDDLLSWWNDDDAANGRRRVVRDFLLKVDYGSLDAKAYLPFHPLVDGA